MRTCSAVVETGVLVLAWRDGAASDFGSSIFTELLPGRTTLCESPATTSTSSGGSAVRFTTAGGAAAWEAGAARGGGGKLERRGGGNGSANGAPASCRRKQTG